MEKGYLLKLLANHLSKEFQFDLPQTSRELAELSFDFFEQLNLLDRTRIDPEEEEQLEDL